MRVLEVLPKELLVAPFLRKAFLSRSSWLPDRQISVRKWSKQKKKIIYSLLSTSPRGQELLGGRSRDGLFSLTLKENRRLLAVLSDSPVRTESMAGRTKDEEIKRHAWQRVYLLGITRLYRTT